MKERQKRKQKERLKGACCLTLSSTGPLGQSCCFNSVLAWEVTLDPLHVLPCSRCKPSLLGCSHIGTQCKLIFFAYSVSTRGETQYENTAPFHTSTPSVSSLRTNYFVWGQTFKRACWGGGSDMLESALSPFNCPSFKGFTCQETERLSLNLWGAQYKKNYQTWFNNHRLIRGMSCIITIVFNNTTVKHLEPLVKVSQHYYWLLIKFKKIWIDRALCTARW